MVIQVKIYSVVIYEFITLTFLEYMAYPKFINQIVHDDLLFLCLILPLTKQQSYLIMFKKEALAVPTDQVKCSFEFKIIRVNRTVSLDHIMVFLDVSTLFSNIRINLVMNSILSRWVHIKNFTRLPPIEFKKGIKFLMNQTGFQFNYNFYREVQRTLMDSPISPILAGLLMKDLQSIVIKNLNLTVHTYFRYVGDTLLILLKEKRDYVLQQINSFHSRIKFTHKIETNNSISFLDVNIIKIDDGTIITDWCRKDTYSGRCINFFSKHSIQHKIAIVQNLVDTSFKLSH